MKVRIRRSMPEVRLEMTPLIDVMFLLVTYFVFALVIMVRADVLDLTLPELGSGTPAPGGHAITVAVDTEGAIRVDGEVVELVDVAGRVRARMDEAPEAALYIALDTEGRVGPGLAVIDALMGAGITKFSMIGRPADAAPRGAENAAPVEPVPAEGP